MRAVFIALLVSLFAGCGGGLSAHGSAMKQGEPRAPICLPDSEPANAEHGSHVQVCRSRPQSVPREKAPAPFNPESCEPIDVKLTPENCRTKLRPNAP